jgi:hypothetical protein
MAWISASWQYILSTPSVVRGGEALRGLVAEASSCPLAACRGSHILGLSLSGGVHHQDPLCLECGLTPRLHVWLNRSSGLLAGELALSWLYLLLSDGLPSAGLCLLRPLMSMTSLEREADFRP